MKYLFYTLALLVGVFALPALAQDDDLDVTMSVIENEGDAEEQLVNDIELPSAASDEAEGNADVGLDAANQARQQGREFGKERAREGVSNRENGSAPSELPTP